MEFSNYNFNINLYLDQNILHCSINSTIELPKDIHYAFYLVKDGSRVKTIWYSHNSTGSFELSDDGNYNVICFIKDKEFVKTYKSNSIHFEIPINTEKRKDKELNNNIVSFDIWGSCVTRDIFAFDIDNKYNVNNYLARNSIISALSPQIKFNIEDISLNSNFQKKQVINDLSKTSFESLVKNKADYIIIDFIDERFALSLFNGSIITLSNEMKLSGIINKPEILRKKKRKSWSGKIKYIINKKDMSEYIDLFCEKINEIYNQDQIIIHKAYMCDNYLNTNNQIIRFEKNFIKNNSEVNELLKYMYDRVAENLCNASILDFCKNYHAAEIHKWGISPMHYQDEYYLNLLEKITEIVATKNINQESQRKK